MSKQSKYCVICKKQPRLSGAYIKACKPCQVKLSDGLAFWMNK